jgi:hypothetical protein
VQDPQAGETRRENIVVDGQQRLATFVLLASRVMRRYDRIKTGSSRLKSLIAKRREAIKKQYIDFEDFRNMSPRVVPRLVLSRYDKEYFRKLVRLEECAPERSSHELLGEATIALDRLLARIITGKTARAQIQELVKLENLLTGAFYVVLLATGDLHDAYRLFQVINDRGMSLKEVDLLRAHTLGHLDKPATQHELNEAETMWDEIQDDSPNRLQDFLRWYYAAHTGKAAGKATLYDEFHSHFFPRTATAGDILRQIKGFQGGVHICRRLRDGEWPFAGASAPDWKRNRLKILVNVLKHNHCMPLLYAAHSLGERRFSEIMHILDKFFFRYKVMCKAHPTPMATVYLKYAEVICKSPSAFDIRDFLKDLRDLLSAHADDEWFRASLEGLKYDEDRGNKEVKFLLITLEENWKWFSMGCRGGMRGRDKNEDHSRVFDFAETTIEHVYPRNVPAADMKPDLEPVKHKLGNMTVLDPGTNSALGNIAFGSKRKHLSLSSNLVNREISQKQKWGEKEVAARQKRLLEAALKIFAV